MMCVVCHVCDRVVTGIASTAAAAAADGAVILILMSAASQLPWRETCHCCSVGVSCLSTTENCTDNRGAARYGIMRVRHGVSKVTYRDIAVRSLTEPHATGTHVPYRITPC